MSNGPGSLTNTAGVCFANTTVALLCAAMPTFARAVQSPSLHYVLLTQHGMHVTGMLARPLIITVHGSKECVAVPHVHQLYTVFGSTS